MPPLTGHMPLDACSGVEIRLLAARPGWSPTCATEADDLGWKRRHVRHVH